MVLDCKQKTLKHSSADVNTSFLFRKRWFSLHKNHFLYNEVPIKGHKSNYRILIPQAWDWFHFKWASLYTCIYLSWDLTVICRTSTLDTWQRVHGASPRCDPWLRVSVMSQENGGRNVKFVPDVHWNLRALKLEYCLSKEANKTIFLHGRKRRSKWKTTEYMG